MSNRDIFSVRSFHDWVGKQPAEAVYVYYSCCDCAFQRYLTAMGMPDSVVTAGSYQVADGSVPRSLPEGLDNAVFMTPRTFGDLHERLGRLLEGEALVRSDGLSRYAMREGGLYSFIRSQFGATPVPADA